MRCRRTTAKIRCAIGFAIVKSDITSSRCFALPPSYINDYVKSVLPISAVISVMKIGAWLPSHEHGTCDCPEGVRD